MKYLILLSFFSLTATADDIESSRQSITDQFRSEVEPTALDATWTDSNVFKVAVRDNRSGRDGYAEYVCGEIYRAGLEGEGILVRIVDYKRLVANGDWVNLGTFFCD